MASAVAVISALIVERTDHPEFLTVTPRGNFTVAEAKRFAEFPVYSVGSSFRGLSLSAVSRTKGNRPAWDKTRHDSLSFLYGSCDIPLDSSGKADGGCGLPLEIQNWPACLRGISSSAPGGLELISIRGVPALYHGSGQLRLIVGRTTIFVHGGSRALLVAAARSLRGANNPVGPTGRLPKPAPGALEDRLEC